MPKVISNRFNKIRKLSKKKLGPNWSGTFGQPRELFTYSGMTKTLRIPRAGLNNISGFTRILRLFIRYLRKGPRTFPQIISPKIRKKPQMKPQSQYLEVQAPITPDYSSSDNFLKLWTQNLSLARPGSLATTPTCLLRGCAFCLRDLFLSSTARSSSCPDPHPAP